MVLNPTSGARRGEPPGGALNIAVPAPGQAHGPVLRGSRPIRIAARAQLGR